MLCNSNQIAQLIIEIHRKIELTCDQMFMLFLGFRACADSTDVVSNGPNLRFKKKITLLFQTMIFICFLQNYCSKCSVNSHAPRLDPNPSVLVMRKFPIENLCVFLAVLRSPTAWLSRCFYCLWHVLKWS